MTCTTCGSIYGQLAKATSESKTPTWECVNGHRQPWGEDEPPLIKELVSLFAEFEAKNLQNAERPEWIEAVSKELVEAQDDVGELDEFMIACAIERHWRQGGGK